MTMTAKRNEKAIAEALHHVQYDGAFRFDHLGCCMTDSELPEIQDT
jgi:hypothetical protein